MYLGKKINHFTYKPFKLITDIIILKAANSTTKSQKSITKRNRNMTDESIIALTKGRGRGV
jgi:hypothetical protein